MSIRKAILLLTAMILAAPCAQPQADARGQSNSSGAGAAITGRILDTQGQPTAGVIVVLCTDADGIPVHNRTFRPITEAYVAEQGEPRKEIAYAATDNNGRFSFDRVAQGEYRLVAQSWPDVKSIKGLFEVNAKVIKLHGIAEHIVVLPGSSRDVEIRPLGTSILEIDADVPNDDTMIVISTKPTRADPILGFAGWSGPFIKNMIGGNRMPGGKTIVYGLPKGKVYFAMFAPDIVPAWADGHVEIKPNATTVLDKVQFVNRSLNSRHYAPEKFQPLVEEFKSSGSLSKYHPIMKLFEEINHQFEGGMWRSARKIVGYLDDEFEFPSGHKTTVGEVLAAHSYILIDRIAKRKEDKLKEKAASKAARRAAYSKYRARYEVKMEKAEKPESIDYTSADTFFPDDLEGGKELDALVMCQYHIRDDPPYGNWLDIIRRGFRRATIDKGAIISSISYEYIARKPDPNQRALDIVYYASFDEKYLVGAVYNGLSRADPKPPKVLQRLVDIALEYRKLGLIAWGVKLSKQQEEFIVMLEPYRNSPDSEVRERAETVVKILEGKIDGGKFSREWGRKQRKQRRQEAATKVRKEFGHELPEVKQILLDGDSEARMAALRRIVVNRLYLITDKSFFDALKKCAEDKDPEVRERTAITLGQHWIWGVTPQSPEAIRIMMQLSKDDEREVRNTAIRYGLSEVHYKDEKVIKRMIDLAMDVDAQASIDAIGWGLRNSASKETMEPYLRPYLDLENDRSERAKRLYRRIFSENPPDK